MLSEAKHLLLFEEFGDKQIPFGFAQGKLSLTLRMTACAYTLIVKLL